MERITIDPTDRSPQVDFDFAAGQLRLSGESYPEDAASFYGPLLEALGKAVPELSGRRVELDVELSYFNSSSAKALMNLFMLLEEAAESGNEVTVRWRYREGDDTLEEAGEDFGADFTAAKFEMIEMPAS
jgi:hypothetical protein